MVLETEEESEHHMRLTVRTTATTILVTLAASLMPLMNATPANAARQKTISIADAALVEGDAGQQTLAFKVTWTGPKGGAPVSVSYATADGTATAGSDYTAKSGSLSLPAGCRCGTISVPILGDTTSEGTETFSIDLASPANSVIGDGHAVGTIFDNEGDPTFVVLDASAGEAAGTMSFDVWMTHASVNTQTVTYTTSDGTALAGSDYTTATNTLTVTPGTTTNSVVVPILNDATNEADEAFTMNLSAGSLTISDAQATGTIVDDDPEPTVSVSDATVAENAGPLSFTISLSALSGQEVDVDYTTTDAAAVAGSDYTAATGTAVIPAGQSSVQIDVPVIDEATYEADEGLTLDLSSPNNASTLDAQGAGTITNDDPVPAATIADAGVVEGNTGTTPATFVVTLDRATEVGATIDWSTADGSATGGSDYVAASGTLTFAPGVLTQDVSIDVTGDSAKELNETFTVTLSNASGATIAGATATGTITDDDRTATALTLKVRKARTKVSAKGVLEAAAADSQVGVSLLKKKGTKWVVLSTRVVTVSNLGDRDSDAIPDAAYHVGFKRPSAGSYRVRAVFGGSAVLLPCSKTVSFTL
jgi:chitinase